MKKLFILPLILFALVACQNQEKEDENNEVANDTEITEETDTNDNEEVEEAINYSFYDDVIAEYAQIEKMTLEEMEEANFTYVKEGALYYFYDSLLYDGISTTYQDLNGDGVDELIVSLSLKQKYGSYHVIDIYTIQDQELVSMFDDQLSTGATTKRSMYYLTDSGQLVLVTSNAQGEGFGQIYEMDEEKGVFVEVYKVSVEGGDFAQIEKALEGAFEFEVLEWDDVVVKAEKYFDQGDFSQIDGKWKTKTSEIEVIFNGEEEKFYFSEDHRLDIVYHEQDDSQAEIPVYFNLQEENGIGGVSLAYYPAGSEIDSIYGIVSSDLTKDRFVITQAPDIGEDDIYYRVSDLEE